MTDGGDGLRELALEDPERTAVIDGRRPITVAELDMRQRKLVGFLRGQGIAGGDRVAVLAGNRAEVLEVTIGNLRAGIIPVPINTLLGPEEISYILSDSGARWLFTDRELDIEIELEGLVTFGDAYERTLHGAPIADLGGFARSRPMHYTSGTTGWPKGVHVPVCNARVARLRSRDFRDLWGITASDVHLVCSPLGHSAPHRFAMRTIEAGGTVVLAPSFEPEAVLATIDLFGVTSTFMVPTHLDRILALGRKKLRGFDLSEIRMLAHAGAPISEGLKEEVLAVFPEDAVWEFYGSTEGPATRISAAEWRRKRGSVGRPRPDARIFIRDDGGRDLPAGELGQIWIEDPHAERFTYWGDEAKSAAAWSGDAYSVGDLGRLDEDGYLYLEGRRHDTIITGGVNVYPQEVERVLLEHEEVAEAVVYGWPNEEWGQEVRALVVPAAEATPETAELIGWLRARLAHFKCPRVLELVGRLERTATGKVRRPQP